MTTEEKAIAYDNALKVANKYKDTHIMFPSIKEEMFPELKESEDEKIRKALLEMVHDTTGDSLWVDYNVHKEDAIAWLEKQGEHAKFCDSIQVGDKVTRNQNGVLVNLSQLKRVAKPADKVEPKFKIGDIISNDISEAKIVSIDKNYYIVTNDEIENDAHVCNWVVYFKNQDDWKLVEQAHAWSEEDEKNFARVDYACLKVYGGDSYSSDWLRKFLGIHKKWKPSDEQIKTCKEVYADILSAKGFDLGTVNNELNRLEEQLKKLREE